MGNKYKITDPKFWQDPIGYILEQINCVKCMFKNGIFVQNSETISFTGNSGSSDDPLTAEVIISPDADNIIEERPNGLYAIGSGGGGTPGGLNTQVQFNDLGAFGGESVFTYDKVNDVLNVPELIVTTAGIQRLRIDQNGAWFVNGNAGTDTYVLVSKGAGNPPQWVNGFFPIVIDSASYVSTGITEGFIDSVYASLPLGSKILFTNMSDDPTKVLSVTKYAPGQYSASVETKLT